MASVSDLVESLRSEYGTACNTEELFAVVKEHIPIKANVIEVRGTPSKYKTTIQCFLQSDEDVESFIKSYNSETKETLRKLSPRVPGKTSPFKKIYYFRCQHRTHTQTTMDVAEAKQKKIGKRIQNTNCPFHMSISLKKSVTGNEPTAIINMEYNHNHEVASLQALTFRDIAEETSNRIVQLFERGLTPGLAYREMLQELKQKFPNDLELHRNLADRSIMPRRKDFNNLYTQFHRNKFRTENIESMLQNLEGKGSPSL